MVPTVGLGGEPGAGGGHGQGHLSAVTVVASHASGSRRSPGSGGLGPGCGGQRTVRSLGPAQGPSHPSPQMVPFQKPPKVHPIVLTSWDSLGLTV